MNDVRPVPTDSSRHPVVQRARQVARLLDETFRVPGTDIRIGVDGLIGLIPVAGDAIGAALSATVLVMAARAGVRPAILARMAGNVLLELVVGAIPVLGDAFDFVWKANRRNADLLERALADPDGTSRNSAALLACIAVTVIATLGAVGYGIYALLAATLGALSGAG